MSEQTWEVRHGNAIELLAAIPAGTVDAVVTDPPYGERAATWDAPRDGMWHEEWLLAVDRVLTPAAPVIVFASRRYVDVVMGAMRRVLGDDSARPLQTGAWIHRQGHPTGGAPGFLRPEHEPFIVSGRLRTVDDDVRALREYQNEHNIARKPTRRNENSRAFKAYTYTPHAVGPMAGTIMEYLVLLACPPGGLVVDPFCGSGTTGVVALRNGRTFLGFDSNAGYVDMARQRIGGPMFAGISA